MLKVIHLKWKDCLFYYLIWSIGIGSIGLTINWLIDVQEPCDGCAAPYGFKHHMRLSTDTSSFAMVCILNNLCSISFLFGSRIQIQLMNIRILDPDPTHEYSDPGSRSNSWIFLSFIYHPKAKFPRFSFFWCRNLNYHAKIRFLGCLSPET